MKWLKKIGDFVMRIIRFLIKKWKFTVPSILALLGLGIYLFFFYFAFHLYFIDDKVDEDIIVFASGLELNMEDDEDNDSDGPTAATTQANPSDTSQSSNQQGETTTEPEQQSNTDPAQAQVQQSLPGEFVDRAHRTSGEAFLITDGAQTFLRINDLRTDNGPDLNVYLVPFGGDASASLYDDDFIDLGDLKGNIGDQNYEVPQGTDLDKYSTVVIWCVRFSVAFGTAELNSLP